MPKPLSEDLRIRVIALIESEKKLKKLLNHLIYLKLRLKDLHGHPALAI